jgi:hypothetical protein
LLQRLISRVFFFHQQQMGPHLTISRFIGPNL